MNLYALIVTVIFGIMHLYAIRFMGFNLKAIYKSYKNLEIMKVTSETKINELLREELEIDNGKFLITDLTGKEGFIKIPVKLKEVKDFNWYIEEYIKITTFIEPHTKKNMLAGEWSVVEFEVLIGLLKFICDDFGMSIVGEIAYYNYGEWHKRLIEICPNLFLESIFKG